MSRLCISLFGRFCVQCGNESSDIFDVSKVQELLCYLLLHRNKPHTREYLAALLWPDKTATQSKQYLRKALWQLQSALDKLLTPTPVLLIESEWIQLNPQADLWLDVRLFEQAYRSVCGLHGEQLTAVQAKEIHQIVSLYQGDLLEGWYQDWCLLERQRLQYAYLSMLDKLIYYSEAQEAYEQGLQYGLSILSIDRARERTHRQLMRLYYLAGDRTGAIRQYQHCIQFLAEELDISPSKRTQTLYHLIEKDELQPESLINDDKHDDISHVNKTIKQLKQIQTVLVRVQDSLQREIDVAQSVLNDEFP